MTRQHGNSGIQAEHPHQHECRAPSQSGRLASGDPVVRSDEQLREDICDQLRRNDDIDASEVSVEVKSGIVVIEGAVPERKMKHLIEDVVGACLGVKAIENNIRVTYGEHHAVHAEANRESSGARASLGTPSGVGVSGISDASSSGSASSAAGKSG